MRKSAAVMRETDLYDPVKHLLQAQGYEVKAEIGAADVVACRDNEPPVIVELKTGFSLALFHQAVERQRVSDFVYVAVPRRAGRTFSQALKKNIALCRRLGVGLMTIRPKDLFVEVHVDPGPYKPRKSTVKKIRLLKEFTKREGDPNKGGSTRTALVTAYRQDALKCLNFLYERGPTKASEVASATDVSSARRIMADDYYGWFERVRRGIYKVTSAGTKAMKEYEPELAMIRA